MIITCQNSDSWNIQSRIEINFISSKHDEEEYVMHSKRDNIRFTPYSDVNEVIDELFESFRLIYQGHLEKLMRGSYFCFWLIPTDVLQIS